MESAKSEDKPFRLKNVLTIDQIDLQIKDSTIGEVLQTLTAKIPHLGENSGGRAALLKALKDREEMHSTGVGDGVAFPHSRNPIIGLVPHASVVFGRHVAGIDFHAIDRKPTHLFFLILSPNVSLHLQILSRLGRLLRDPKLRQDLMNASSPQQALEIISTAEESWLS